MAKVVIELEDREDGLVDFNVDMPDLKEEKDVTMAVVTAVYMLDSIKKMKVQSKEDWEDDPDGERLEG